MTSSQSPWRPLPDTDRDRDRESGTNGDTDHHTPRWLAPDAKPATTAVLERFETSDGVTVAELADATGFTQRTIDRILGELATAGAVRESARRNPSMYWRQRRTNSE